MKTTNRTVRLRTRQTRKSRAVLLRSGATAEEMRKMGDFRKRGAAMAPKPETREGAAKPLRLRLRSQATPRRGGLVPAGKAEREVAVLRRTRARLRVREKGRPTPGGDRKTSLE